MPVLPIMFIFVIFWSSDTTEVARITPEQAIECKIDPSEYEIFYSDEDECYYAAMIVNAARQKALMNVLKGRNERMFWDSVTCIQECNQYKS